MTSQNGRLQIPTQEADDQEFIRAHTAMRRAAYVAQKRAIATTGSYPVWEDGSIVYCTTVNEELAKEFERV